MMIRYFTSIDSSSPTPPSLPNFQTGITNTGATNLYLTVNPPYTNIGPSTPYIAVGVTTGHI